MLKGYVSCGHEHLIISIKVILKIRARPQTNMIVARG